MKALIVGAILLRFSSLTYADDINSRTGLPPSVQNKVNGVIADAYLRQSTLKDDYSQVRDQDNQGSGGSVQTINSFTNVRQAPREVITVADDIVNICFHCR